MITNSMNAKVKNGMAILEEFLQEKYVENYDKISEQDIKVKGLRDSYPDYFYDPAKDGYGVEHYVTDSEGHALYLINKEGLPDEIKKALSGGNAGEKTYRDYQTLKDVYGVTFDLKVWYSSGDGKINGISSDKLDKDDLTRTVLDSSSELARLISNREDGTITANDVQSIKNIVINDEVSSLEDLFALTSLQSITFDGSKMSNLDGIQNATSLNTIYFKNCNINNYSALSKLGNKLTHLSFYNIDDNELSYFCNGVKEANFGSLTHFAIVGNESYIWYAGDNAGSDGKSDRTITNLLPLSSVGENVFKNVTHLSLQNENISDTIENDKTKYALENLANFSNLNLLRIERNKLTTLKGLEKMNQLQYLYASYNELGKNEIYNTLENREGDTEENRGKNSSLDALSSLSGKTSLNYIYLQGNTKLKWVGYLSECTGIKILHFGSDSTKDCISMIDSEVSKLRDIFNKCGKNKSYPSKYWLSLLDKEDNDLEVKLSGQTITLDQFNELKDYSNIKILDLLNIKIKKSDIDNDLIDNNEKYVNQLVNDVLKNMKNLKYLRLSASSGTSLVNLSEITFLKGVDENNREDDIDLIELAAYGTKISTRRSGEDNTYENGLKLLDKKDGDGERSSFYYCPSLKYLIINEPNTKLSDINDRIVYLVGIDDGGSSYFYGSNYYHFATNNDSVLNSLSQCTGFTKIIMRGGCSSEVNLDFSSTNVTKLVFSFGNYNCNLSLPDSCKEVALEGFNGDLSLANLDNFKLTTHGTNRENLKKLLLSVGADKSIETLGFRVQVLEGNDLGLFEEISQERNSKLKIKELSCQTNTLILDNFKSLDGIEGIDGLESISLDANRYPNLTDIDALYSQKDTLKSLSIAGASISHCGVLADFTNLTYVDLQNNSLSSFYDTDSGERINNIKVICEAVKRGAEKNSVTGTIKLKGNPGVIDWSPYIENQSLWGSGSNYGS